MSWGCSGRDRLPLWTELSAEIRQTSRNAVSLVGGGCGKPLSRWSLAAGHREKGWDAVGEATGPEVRSLRQLEPMVFLELRPSIDVGRKLSPTPAGGESRSLEETQYPKYSCALGRAQTEAPVTGD